MGGGGAGETRKSKIEAKNQEQREARRKMASEHKERNLADEAAGLRGERGGVYRDNRIRQARESGHGGEDGGSRTGGFRGGFRGGARGGFGRGGARGGRGGGRGGFGGGERY